MSGHFSRDAQPVDWEEIMQYYQNVSSQNNLNHAPRDVDSEKEEDAQQAAVDAQEAAVTVVDEDTDDSTQSHGSNPVDAVSDYSTQSHGSNPVDAVSDYSTQ
eukprot:278375_1